MKPGNEKIQNIFRNIGRPVVLDVTLRDGGYLNNWNFSYENIEAAITTASNMGADIIETGYLDDGPGLPVAASCPPEFLMWVKTLQNSSLIAAMIRPAVESAEQVLNSRKEHIDLVRIPVNLKDVDCANRLSEKCSKYGVPFTFNLTSVTCYTRHEIELAVKLLNKNSTAIYIADSRGALLYADVKDLVKSIQSEWEGPIGFHAHNNLGLAVKNTEEAVMAGCEYIDGSLCGIGLGGRNLNLTDAIEIATIYRDDLQLKESDIVITEASLGVKPPADEMILYRLSGERNIKMEWVQLMIEQLGIDVTRRIIKKIPNRVFFDPIELKPFIKKRYWEEIEW